MTLLKCYFKMLTDCLEYSRKKSLMVDAFNDGVHRDDPYNGLTQRWDDPFFVENIGKRGFLDSIVAYPVVSLSFPSGPLS